MECLSYCIANRIDLTRLDNHYKKTQDLHCDSARTRDVVRLRPYQKPTALVYVFKNGTIVSWGLKRYQVGDYLETIKQFVDKPTSLKLSDTFSYRLAEKTSIAPNDFFDVDCITLEDDSDNLKLSLSYGFSQSVKLQYFETIIDTLIEKYSPFIHKLSAKGVMRISRNQIRRVIGEILGAKSEMNLISNFLYHPKYFWQHPIMEEYYSMLERYLHIQRRVNAINHRLDTLNEIFEMFNGYLENRHAHILEVIIIVLIMVEIIFGVMNIHL